jgi:hypothetical protein
MMMKVEHLYQQYHLNKNAPLSLPLWTGISKMKMSD